ncbi:MAG TPA: dipicolinate synthase subunit B [Candidatus Ornithomonoglobus intestinigallinarum]|uniref:Dipicolinate synthase subunit B n=1 Tax=Candidatus Ornithomonoglobus intestinigallinarum TaxID=2840894 RepID=A0A9D1H459_9FIRM|nr:dipicolinate synthase subunit B [Candidatus Ornithomonoglobus intestinigallinarum]
MDLKGKRIGFAMCGSFCTFARAVKALEALSVTGADIVPVMSPVSAVTDTRFGTAEHFRSAVERITGKSIITTIKEAEPIGPKALLDMLVIMPCTGNTLAKLAAGIADTSVTMAVKAHLRNQRPVLIAVSTNDGLGAAAKNIAALMNSKHIFFVPFSQDDCLKKPNSLVADFELLLPAAEAAMDNRQLQPVFAAK